jgi:hypothetical protein
MLFRPGSAQTTALPDACQLSGHCFGIIHELADAIMVRSAKGEVRIQSSLPDDPLEGATVEIFGSDQSGGRSGETDSHGRFIIKGLREGRYSFHIGKPGFNSVVGQLIISRHASPQKKIHVELSFGV